MYAISRTRGWPVTQNGRSIGYVLPVYNEAAVLPHFHRALLDATSQRPDLDFEFIYVDDGSKDASVDVLEGIRREDARVTIISLARNSGHQTALTAGQDHATRHDAVVVMDCDLQDPPGVTLEFIEAWENGAQLVYGVRRSRRDGFFKKATAEVFYRVLARAASLEIPRQAGDFRLMDRVVVLELNRYREHNRFLRGMAAHVGYRQQAVLFDRAERFAGESKYPWRSMVKLAGDGIVGFSTLPLKMIAWSGIFLSLLSLIGAVVTVGIRLLSPERTLPGWTSLAVVMLLLSGIQLLFLGVIGSYLGRMYVELLGRPLYSVSDISRGDTGPLQPRQKVEVHGVSEDVLKRHDA